MYVGCMRVYYLDGGGLWTILVLVIVFGLLGMMTLSMLIFLILEPNSSIVGFMHEMHEPILLTVVYGANEVIARRELWQGLTELAVSVDLPLYGWTEPLKRLDCMFVNDAWLERWPNLFYTCLTPRTSDHSPLVLKGDSQDVQKKGDLAMNVKLAAGFLEIAQKLLQADRHNSLLLQLENCCRLVYLKATQLEHVMLRQRAKLQWLKGGDQCSKCLCVLFPRSVGWDRAERAIDLHYLRLWARHILTEEEAYALIRPVTVDDVKTALFDIEEDKAPGPDGFSSGRLLKQVNATVLTLIPKNAFVPGRLISDNVLLAQELFSGYNQCRLPPRCALKVDLRKAYDTVEWDFLFATLRLFGFPAVFIRQGDPMSPYLFVLVMEVLQMILQQFIDQDGQFLYHWRCTELKLFQLSFADDLLLLCKADVQSKKPIDYSKAASDSGIHCLRHWGFRKATYLLGLGGSPALLAGRVQLIKSVLVSLEVYWAMAFILPKGIIKEMIKRLRTFLWKGTSFSGYPKVAWEIVCRPVEEGGQGIKDIFALNRALMSKHLWAIIKQVRTSIWVDWIFRVRLRDCSIWTAKDNKGQYRISWKSNDGSFNTSTAYDLFRQPGPKVVFVRNAICDDSSNVVGHPRLWEIWWLKSLDKGSLAFSYGKLLEHLERNARRFQQRSRPPSIVGRLVVEEIRQRIISVPLRHSICSLDLYRLWKIP
ncbi:hypothetical protein Sango_3083500 [Sesamum angolense]|uniref:Reverse transcriptase domain-containing protein n=1 Tax=Sesamum angolense TaxID=2727404 RepID=A0AAE1TAS2_9LAMI|nr:hypothetical protein Sango_3083500 [Sesamum angolense]